MVRLRFLHGWGFDASFWAQVIAEMPDMKIDCDDRGYFDRETIPKANAPFIFVTHSFGSMRALSGPKALCRGMVAINGFDRFTPGVPPRVVERMISKFESDPTAVLGDFRRRCEDYSTFGPPNIERLRTDLIALREMDCTAASAAWSTPTLSVQGAADPILSAAMRQEAFAEMPIVERITHPTGGHLLPISAPRYCARAIEAFAAKVG